MKLYLVSSPDNNSDDEIYGVYSTMEKAERAKDVFCASDILELELDWLPELPAGMMPYSAEITWSYSESGGKYNGPEVHRVGFGHEASSVWNKWHVAAWYPDGIKVFGEGLFRNEAEALESVQAVQRRYETDAGFRALVESVRQKSRNAPFQKLTSIDRENWSIVD